MGILDRSFILDFPLLQRATDLPQALRRGGKRVSRCAFRCDRRAALLFLQIHADAFSRDGDERMRSQGPRADGKTMALDDFAAKNLRIKIFSDNDVVDRYHEMIEALNQHFALLHKIFLFAIAYYRVSRVSSWFRAATHSERFLALLGMTRKK